MTSLNIWYDIFVSKHNCNSVSHYLNIALRKYKTVPRREFKYNEYQIGSILTENDGNIIYVEDCIKKISGYNDGLIGKSIQNLFNSFDSLFFKEQNLRKIFKNGNSVSYITSLTKRNKEIISVIISIRLLSNDSYFNSELIFTIIKVLASLKNIIPNL